jgi:hypothetical protein
VVNGNTFAFKITRENKVRFLDSDFLYIFFFIDFGLFLGDWGVGVGVEQCLEISTTVNFYE